MTVAFTNFASTRTTSILLAGGTSFSVTPGSGANFPATAGGAWFYLVLTDSLTAPTVREVIKVTNRSTDSMATIVRAQDGTTALNWPSGSYCELRLTKGTLEDLQTAALQAANNLSDLTNQVAARANLQLSTMATQPANSVSISGGAISSCQITGSTLDITPVGSISPSTGSFTTLAASGAVSGAGFVSRFSTPGAIGDVTPGSGAFTTLSASGAVSGAGITARFSTPGPIGDGTPSTGAFTTLAASGAVSGAGITARFSTPGPIGDSTPSTGAFTTLTANAAIQTDGTAGIVYSADWQNSFGEQLLLKTLGTICFLYFQADCLTNAASTILTLPVGYIPAVSLSFTGTYHPNAGGVRGVQFTVSDAGVVYVQNNYPSGGPTAIGDRIFVSVMYFAA